LRNNNFGIPNHQNEIERLILKIILAAIGIDIEEPKK